MTQATMDAMPTAPQPGAIAAVKRFLYVLKQAEKLMPPVSFNMMKKALFSVGRRVESQAVFLLPSYEDAGVGRAEGKDGRGESAGST